MQEAQYIVTMFGEMSVTPLLHVDGDKINTKPMCPKYPPSPFKLSIGTNG